VDEPKLPSVMVVDDDQSTLQLIARYLVTLDVNPVLAGNADEAISMLTEFSDDIKIVFLDLTMPHVDGFQLAAAIRRMQKFDKIPLVVLTARRDIEAQQSALGAGAEEVIAKPFAPKQLKNTLMKYHVIPLE
jgi:CheY-like chemotaxis protein